MWHGVGIRELGTSLQVCFKDKITAPVSCPNPFTMLHMAFFLLCVLFLKGYQSVDLGSTFIHYGLILTNFVFHDLTFKYAPILKY